MSPLHFLVSQKKEDTHDTILLRKRILFGVQQQKIAK